VCIPRRRIAAHSGTWTNNNNNNNNNNFAKPKGGGGVTWIFKVVSIGKLVEFKKISPHPVPLVFPKKNFLFPNATCLWGAILFDKIVSIFVAFCCLPIETTFKRKNIK
jgi:hypothetical protein